MEFLVQIGRYLSDSDGLEFSDLATAAGVFQHKRVLCIQATLPNGNVNGRIDDNNMIRVRT